MYLDDGSFDGPDGIAKVIAVLTAGHLDTYGGYPYDWMRYDDKVFIAELDPAKERNRTLLTVYDVEELEQWERRAVEYKQEFPDADWVEAVRDTTE